MFVNAAIVFASGPSRWVGIASVAAVLRVARAAATCNTGMRVAKPEI